MKVSIRPSRLSGTVNAPPSKSMTHRLLICAGLGDGLSRIENIEPSDDVMATIDCLKALGADISFAGRNLSVKGFDPESCGSATLKCRESASTLRFLIPLCLLNGNEMRFEGSNRLFSRPLSVYEDLFRDRGICFEKEKDCLRLKGRLSSGEFSVPGDVSSQFVSGLLFALPLLEGDSRLIIKAPVLSGTYIDMTIKALEDFGIELTREDESHIYIPGRQSYGSRDRKVEGDWSNAAFLIALGLDVKGLDDKSLQGDKICREYFSRLDDGFACLDLSDCPDLGPVMMACAALKHGGRFRGTDRLRLKESDRTEAMRQELEKFGVDVNVGENETTIGCGLKVPSKPLYGHGDHRVVMALALLCCSTGGTILGAEAVRKSYPDFFEVIKSCGVDMDIVKEQAYEDGF